MPRPDRAPAPRRRRDFEQNRETLLRHARRIIAERGPEALTVSEVAHRAALNRTTAYQHFRTRDELVGAVMGALGDEVSAMLTAPMPIGERIDQMARFFVEHPEIARLTLHHLLAENPFPRRGWERYVGELDRLAKSRRSQDGVDVEMLAHVLMAAGLLWSLRVRVEYDEDEVAEATERLSREVKRLLLHGLLRPERWPELVAALEPKKERP